MNLQTILLQAEGATGGMGNMLLMMVLLFVVMYFFMIRPQSKRQKEIKKFREGLQVGDKVVTAGGIHGKIKEIKPDHVIVEIANNVNIKVDKGSVYASAAEAPQQQQK